MVIGSFYGKDKKVFKPRLEQSNNSEFWIKKFLERGTMKLKKLLFMGEIVIHFWDNDIKKNTEECVRVVEETIFESDDWMKQGQ